MEYLIHLAILCCLYLILCQSFNLNFGLGASFNLAHVASFALGAYATALLSTEQDWGVALCLSSSVIVSGVFALLIGLIARRLKQDYFAIGTLAFSAVVTALLINWKSLTRGVLGVPGIPRPVIGIVNFYENTNFLIFIGIAAALSQLVLWHLFHCPFARKLKAQSEFENGALAMGIDTGYVRQVSFIIASAFAGLAGAMYAYYLNYIDPSSFSLNEMIFIITVVVIGRPGSFWGVTASTIFLVLLPEPLRFLDIPASVLGPMRQLIYALLLFVTVYWQRANLFPRERKV